MNQNDASRVPGSPREAFPEAGEARTARASDAAKRAAHAKCQVFPRPFRSPPLESSNSAKPWYRPRKREDAFRFGKNRVHKNRVSQVDRSARQPERFEWRRVLLPALHQ